MRARTLTLRLALRGRLLASVPVAAVGVGFNVVAASPARAEPVDEAAWSEESWRKDLERAAERARVTHPGAEARLSRLEGLDPDVYLARRRAEPEVARELSRLVKRGEVPAALLARLALQLDDGSARYPFSPAERFEKRAPAEVTRLMAMERAQLRAGLLLALGDARHPSALYLARTALLDDGRALEERRVAAIALGKTRDARAVPLLSRVARESKAALELRTSALAGLAHVRSLGAVRALEELSRESVEPVLLRASALSLGNAASASALLSRAGDEEAEAMRARASSALVDLLVRSDDARVTNAVVDALGMVAHPLAADRLRTLARDEGTSGALRERVVRAERRLERALARGVR